MENYREMKLFMYKKSILLKLLISNNFENPFLLCIKKIKNHIINDVKLSKKY